MQRVKRSSKKGPAVKVAELAIAAPQVIAHRTARVLAAGANPGAADRAELSRMGTEKVQAFWESVFAIGAQAMRSNQEYVRLGALQWWRLWTTPWWLAAARPAAQAMAALPRAAIVAATQSASPQARAVAELAPAGLGPIHKRATANARRLTRSRKRTAK